MIEYHYGSSRGNKVWIGGYIKQSKFRWINMSVEINKDASKSKIVWIIQQSRKPDIKITYEEFQREYDNDVIKEAYEFAKEKGYLKRWE